MYEPYDSVLLDLLLVETFFGVFAAFFPTDGVLAILMLFELFMLIVTTSFWHGPGHLQCENGLGIEHQMLFRLNSSHP